MLKPINVWMFGVGPRGIVGASAQLRELLPEAQVDDVTVWGLSAEFDTAARQISDAANLDIVLISCGGRYRAHQVEAYARHIAPHIAAHPDQPVAGMCKQLFRLATILQSVGVTVERVDGTQQLCRLIETRR